MDETVKISLKESNQLMRRPSELLLFKQWFSLIEMTIMVLFSGGAIFGHSSGNFKLFLYICTLLGVDYLKQLKNYLSNREIYSKCQWTLVVTMLQNLLYVNMFFAVCSYFKEMILGSLILYFLFRYVKNKVSKYYVNLQAKESILKLFQNLVLGAFIISEVGPGSILQKVFTLLNLLIVYDLECIYIHSQTLLDSVHLYSQRRTVLKRNTVKQHLLEVVCLLVLQNLTLLWERGWEGVVGSMQTLSLGVFVYWLAIKFYR